MVIQRKITWEQPSGHLDWSAPFLFQDCEAMDFHAGPMAKNLPTNAGNMGLIPALGRFHMPQGN